MRSSEVRGPATLTLAAFVMSLLLLVLSGCASRDPARLALRDRIEQGALTPEDVQRFRPSDTELQAAVATASETPLRRASALDRELLDAAARGEPARLRELLRQGAQVNAVDEWGQTPLLLAATLGDLESARVLLRARADANGRGGPLTPLGAAALRGHVHMARLLLRHGALVDQAGLNELTPLVNAVKLNRLEVADVLLQAGASTQAVDRSGDGLLVIAINENLPEMLDRLLRHGLNPNQPDANGLTPLYWARQLQREDLAQRLVQAGAQPALERQTLRASRPYLQEDF